MEIKMECNDSEQVSKLHFHKQIKFKDGPIVSLVRLEDDPELQFYVCKKNIQNPRNKVNGSIAQNTVDFSVRKVIGVTETSIVNIRSDSPDLCSDSKLKINPISNINNMSFDFTKEESVCSQTASNEYSCATPDIVSEVEVDSNSLQTNKNSLLKKGNGDHSVSLKGKINRSKNIKPGSASQRSGKVEGSINDKSCNVISDVFVSSLKDDNLSINENPLNDDEAMNTSSKRKISQHIKEPLRLLSKLTGCQIPPNKVRILSLSEPEVSSSSTQVEENDHTILKRLCYNSDKNSASKVINSGVDNVNGNNHHYNSSVVSCNDKNKCHRNNLTRSIVENLDAVEDVRTVYDLMEYISVVMPSWNLHVLPDTNTFCICQVTRSKLGIPRISKCIELDDNFNGKVYINENHCRRYDGVYSSEDAVVALIKEVDKIR